MSVQCKEEDNWNQHIPFPDWMLDRITASTVEARVGYGSLETQLGAIESFFVPLNIQ